MSFSRSYSEYNYSSQTSYTHSLNSPTRPDDDDDHVFEPTPPNDDRSSNDNIQDSEIVQIPCEFCGEAQTGENFHRHQLRCSQNPNRVRRTNLETNRRPREPLRRTVSTSAPVITRTPPRARSPSPTEGFTPPPELLCPITHSLLRDPVVGSDGHTYEREAIMHHLRQSPTSPMTREPMSIDKLNPNLVVKNLVDNFVNECKRKRLLHKYKLDSDVKKTESRPFMKTDICSIYRAEWIKQDSTSNNSNIVLIHLTGENAERIALANCRLAPHENLVQTLGGVEHNGTDVFLVQESLSSQTLSQLIKTSKTGFSIRILDSILFQIASAMAHLIKEGVTFHGNLTANNVLIDHFDQESENILIKLNTFGNVEQDKADTDRDDLTPNAYTKDKLTKQSEVYAFGELGEHIYSSISDSDIDYLQKRKDLLQRCLEHEPFKQPKFDDLIQTWKTFLDTEISN